jgi:hypothetical protein
MLELIPPGFDARNRVIYPETVDVLQIHHQISICSDTLPHAIRNLDTVKAIIDTPMEADRTAVNPEERQAWFERLAAEVAGVSRGFVLNVDEIGSSDHTDRQDARVVVCVEYPDSSVLILYERHSKRSTLITCIAADGFRMKRFVIVHRTRAEKELEYYGYDAQNAIFISQKTALVTTALFETWAISIFFPTIEQRRMEHGYHSKATLLSDGLTSHHSEKPLAECSTRDLKVIFMIPHASDQTQSLDLLTFVLMKQRFSASKFGRLENPQSKKVVRILGVWFAAIAPHHNVETFMNLGLIPEQHEGGSSEKLSLSKPVECED